MHPQVRLVVFLFVCVFLEKSLQVSEQCSNRPPPIQTPKGRPQRWCREDTACYRQDCYFVHPCTPDKPCFANTCSHLELSPKSDLEPEILPAMQAQYFYYHETLCVPSPPLQPTPQEFYFLQSRTSSPASSPLLGPMYDPFAPPLFHFSEDEVQGQTELLCPPSAFKDLFSPPSGRSSSDDSDDLYTVHNNYEGLHSTSVSVADFVFGEPPAPAPQPTPFLRALLFGDGDKDRAKDWDHGRATKSMNRASDTGRQALAQKTNMASAAKWVTKQQKNDFKVPQSRPPRCSQHKLKTHTLCNPSLSGYKRPTPYPNQSRLRTSTKSSSQPGSLTDWVVAGSNKRCNVQNELHSKAHTSNKKPFSTCSFEALSFSSASSSANPFSALQNRAQPQVAVGEVRNVLHVNANEASTTLRTSTRAALSESDVNTELRRSFNTTHVKPKQRRSRRHSMRSRQHLDSDPDTLKSFDLAQSRYGSLVVLVGLPAA